MEPDQTIADIGRILAFRGFAVMTGGEQMASRKLQRPAGADYSSSVSWAERKYLGGESIAKHFDMVAGTSTGGTMALGLAAGKSAAEISKIYTGRGVDPSGTDVRNRPLAPAEVLLPPQASQRQPPGRTAPCLRVTRCWTRRHAVPSFPASRGSTANPSSTRPRTILTTRRTGIRRWSISHFTPLRRLRICLRSTATDTRC